MASEKGLRIDVAEMTIQGIATRRVKDVLESFCAFEISAMEVSRVVKEIELVLQSLRERPIRVTPFD